MSDQSPLLCQSDQSVLVVVDVQARLARAMPEGSLEHVKRNLARLLQSAALMSVPVLVTEQYPRGLGSTLEDVKALLAPAAEVFEKTTFSATGCDDFMETLEITGRRQVVVTGMESHVCVLQSAIELHRAGYEVFVVQDAVCSRQQVHVEAALARLRDAGIHIPVCESVLFEWLRDSDDEHFKAVSALIR